MLFFKSLLPFLLLCGARSVVSSEVTSLGFPHHKKTCVVKPGGSIETDDAPAIVEAFDRCGHGGRVVFLNTTYHVNSVLDTTDLEDCDIDLHGTMLVWPH